MNFRTQIAIVLCTLLCAVKGYGQVFWTEDFNSGPCNCEADAYSGLQGPWGIFNLPTNDAISNTFFVSCQENGEATGTCGAACGSNPTLHVSPEFGDLGAAYYAGPLGTTTKMAFSPAIDCSGKSNITISFRYIEGGEGIQDNALLFYFNGSSWQNIGDPPKTICCGGNPCTGGNQGVWNTFSVLLPTTANNNPNVQIGFRWANDADNIGEDPSFAVDDITLSTPVSNTITTGTISGSPFCAGSSISIPFTSTGTFTAGNIYTAQLSNASGSFGSPVNIGTLSSTANSGTISGTIPAGSANGAAYLIRVISNNPSVIGSSSVAFTINALPVITQPGLTASSNICSGSAPNITIDGTPAGTTFSWTGDNGSSGSGQILNTILANNACANIVVTFTITPSFNGCIGSIRTHPVTVRPYPTSYFSITPNPACVNQSAIATFTGTACPGATYNWTLPAGTTPSTVSGAGPHTLQWAIGGDKIVNLQVQNPSGGCTGTLVRDTISVIGLPTLLPAQPCAGTTPTFTSGNGTNYEFFVNSVSQGAASSTNNFTPGAAVVAGQQVCVRSYNTPQITYDGNLTDAEWGTADARRRKHLLYRARQCKFATAFWGRDD